MEHKEEAVIERPADYRIQTPSNDHSLIEPFAIFTQNASISRTALVVLNTTISNINVEKLWKSTELHICADGGANRLFNYFQLEEDRSKHIPHFITGDCDSLEDSVETYYKAKGTIVIRQTTQYATDFMKSMQLVDLYFLDDSTRAQLSGGKINEYDGLNELTLTSKTDADADLSDTIKAYILGGIGGRFDQTVHSISLLYRLSDSHPHLQNFFITDTDLIFMIKKGKNHVKYELKLLFNKKDATPIMGLLPFENTVTINSDGLKYDVANWVSNISGKVSSSNAICGVDGFTVEVSDKIVLNVEIDHSY